MGKSETSHKYILLMNDDLSGYVWLQPAVAVDADAVVEGLLTLFSTFGVMRTWVSDQGSHFKNEVIERLQ